jgi:hypothetical protein
MAEPLDVTALTEELTIQQVILDSLRDEHFDNIEEERREARLEIERIKALLDKAQRDARHTNHGEPPPSRFSYPLRTLSRYLILHRACVMFETRLAASLKLLLIKPQLSCNLTFSASCTLRHLTLGATFWPGSRLQRCKFQHPVYTSFPFIFPIFPLSLSAPWSSVCLVSSRFTVEAQVRPHQALPHPDIRLGSPLSLRLAMLPRKRRNLLHARCSLTFPFYLTR